MLIKQVQLFFASLTFYILFSIFYLRNQDKIKDLFSVDRSFQTDLKSSQTLMSNENKQINGFKRGQLPSGHHFQDDDKKRFNKVSFLASPPGKHNTTLSYDINRDENKKIVLIWTKMKRDENKWRNYFKEGFSDCAINNCAIIDDRKHVAMADLLLFHHGDMSRQDVPRFRAPGQRWALFINDPLQGSKHLHDWGDQFNLTISYRNTSDIQVS